MAEEKEAPAAPSTFSSLENLISIRLWIKTLLEDRKVNEVVLEGLHEEFAFVENDLDIRPVCYSRIIVVLVALYINICGTELPKLFNDLFRSG